MPVEAARQPDVHQRLRIQRQVGAGRSEGNLLQPQRRQHLQRRDDAVAGGVAVEADDVAGVLAAQLPAALDQRLQHVAVADLGAHDGHAQLRQRMLHAEVGHQGADHAGQAAAARRLRAMT
jgi:hypothetical protein